MDKDKIKNVTKCYTDLRPDQKKLLYYTVSGFGVGLVLGILIGRRR